jgi:carbonic anhydrase
MTNPTELIAGFHRFREQHFTDDDALYRQLVQDGQTPKILVVACCDSRVDPALVLDCAPGDLFVIRNVANLVPPAESSDTGRHGTSAALEYGVRVLKVEHIIVLGHAHCGGIRSLMNGGSRAGTRATYLDSWMRLAEEAQNKVINEMPNASVENHERACEKQAILSSLENLMSFDWIREGVANRTLMLHGWYFDIEHGQLLRFDKNSQRFEVV